MDHPKVGELPQERSLSFSESPLMAHKTMKQVSSRMLHFLGNFLLVTDSRMRCPSGPGPSSGRPSDLRSELRFQWDIARVLWTAPLRWIFWNSANTPWVLKVSQLFIPGYAILVQRDFDCPIRSWFGRVRTGATVVGPCLDISGGRRHWISGGRYGGQQVRKTRLLQHLWCSSGLGSHLLTTKFSWSNWPMQLVMLL